MKLSVVPNPMGVTAAMIVKCKALGMLLMNVNSLTLVVGVSHLPGATTDEVMPPLGYGWIDSWQQMIGSFVSIL